MPRIVLVRHGQTEWSATGRHTGRTDVPLLPSGRRQADAAGRLLRALLPDPGAALVLSSPRQRARDTARLAGLAVGEVLDDLAEWDYGEYEGRTTPEIRETDPGWTVWTHPCPGGEAAGDVAARADRVLARAAAARAERDVVLVGHGHFSRVLAARWLGLPAAAGVSFLHGAGALTVLTDERGAPCLEHANLQEL